MAKRSSRETREALEKGLKGMFKSLETRPLPDRLRSVVDQLDDDGETEAPKKAAR